MGKIIGFEGTIEGVEKTVNGAQLIIKPITVTGKVPQNMWIIPAGDFILRANELWSEKIRKGGSAAGTANVQLKGKKIMFYIKD